MATSGPIFGLFGRREIEVVDLTGDDSNPAPPRPLSSNEVAPPSATQTFAKAAEQENTLCVPAVPSSPVPPISQQASSEYHLLELSNMFQPLYDLPSTAHECTEDGLRAIVNALPAPKVWNERCNAVVPSYSPSDFQFPPLLLEWLTISIPSSKVPQPPFNVLPPFPSKSPPCARLVQSLVPQLQQTLQLPIQAFPNWGVVNSLEELRRKVIKAKEEGRMLICVCSGQNRQYWLPNVFHKLAQQHPRIMFAAIDRDDANQSGTDDLCRELLGFDYIDGVSFVSHSPGEGHSRSFNGNRTSTEDIHSALLTRYHVNCMEGLIAPLEPDAVLSSLQVNWLAAYFACYSQLRVQPHRAAFSFRIEPTVTSMSSMRIEDRDAFLPAAGFPLRGNANELTIQQPSKIILPLLSEQLQSIAWMISRERDPFHCTSVHSHHALIPIPPLAEHCLHFRLEAEHFLRGGVLADSIGFGKTACVLGLIATQPLLSFADMEKSRPAPGLIPSRATLVVVPSHLVHQWACECKKFLDPGWKIVTITRANDVPSAKGLATADIVIVPTSLFDSNVYQSAHLKVGTSSGSRQLASLKKANSEPFLHLATKKRKFAKGEQASRSSSFASNSVSSTIPSNSPMFLESSLQPISFSSGLSPENSMASYFWTAVVDLVSHLSPELREGCKLAYMSGDSTVKIPVSCSPTLPSSQPLQSGPSSESVAPPARKRTRATPAATAADIPVASGPEDSRVLPLEAFYWQRLVIDEMHEAIKDLSPECMTPLYYRCLQAHCRWGLTATPPLESFQSIDAMAHLLHGGTGLWDVDCVRRFVASCFTSSHRTEQSYPPPVEQTVLINLTPQEMALYRQTKYDLLHQQKHVSEAVVVEAMLLQASHFSLNHTALTRDNKGATGADNQLQALKQKKLDQINQLRNRRQDLVRQLEFLQTSLRSENSGCGTGDLTAASEEQRRKKLADLLGRKEETQDQLHVVNRDLHTLQASMDYFEATLQQLQQGRSLSECPICLEKMTFGNACMAPCGHVQCIPCAVKLATEFHRCASCRQPLVRNQWRVLYEEDFANEAGSAEWLEGVRSRNSLPMDSKQFKMIDKPDPTYYGMAMGSKLAYLVSQIHSILQQEPNAKMLVYCQWNSLKMRIRDAFTVAGLRFATLEGEANILKEVLRRFSEPKPDAEKKDQTNILLCSLEAKAAGLNLQCCGHVMFVHPFFSLNEAQAAAWEAQAIGRVLRPGQTKTVHIWRFVSLETIDQEILVKRQVASWKTHFRNLSTT